jgi:hypothetical protein
MKIIKFVKILIFTLILVEFALASGEEINWQVISEGGTQASQDNIYLQGTLGQTAVGPCSGTNTSLNSGFWQNFGMDYICGDANRDYSINVSDCVWMLNYIFIPGSPPPVPLESGEVNCDGAFNVSDVVWLLNYIFIPGNPAPCDC